jgi:hypothetical protein
MTKQGFAGVGDQLLAGLRGASVAAPQVSPLDPLRLVDLPEQESSGGPGLVVDLSA